MNIRPLPLLAALLMSGAPALPAWAQASAPGVAASAADAPPGRGPRLLSPAEKRDNAEAAASPDLRPERPVVPQLSIPFGKTPPAPASAPRAARKPPAGGVADAAARCEAQPSDAERAACRKRHTRIAAPD